MNDTTTPTPRSREEWRRIARLPDGIYTLKSNYGELAHGMLNFAEQLERELTEVTKQRDALAEALRKLADCDWVITLPDRMDAVRTIADEALQSLTPIKP
jgi:hypothetical protein